MKFSFKNKLNKTLYQTFFVKGTPLTEPRNFKNDLLSGYLDNEIIYSIINKIADTASSVPLKVEKMDGQDVKSHWVIDLINRPNPDNSMKEIIYNYYIYLLSLGNSYIYAPKIKRETYITKEFWTMPSEEVYIIKGQFYEPIKGYKMYVGTQNESELKKSDVFHGKLFNPRFQEGEWLYGLSPISIAENSIQSYENGVKSLISSYKNMGPPYIISSQLIEGLTQTQQENLEEVFKKKYGNPENFNKPMLTGTPIKVEKVGSNPVDLNILENQKELLKTFCNIYGVSSVLFNDDSKSTYNNINQARKDFYEYTIKPLNDSFSEKMNIFLGLTDVRLRFDYSNVEVLQEGLLDKAQALDKMDFLTDDEKREQFGYDPKKNK